MKVWRAEVSFGRGENEDILIFRDKPSNLEVIEGLFEIYPRYFEGDNAEDIAREPEAYEIYIELKEARAARRGQVIPE